MTTSALTAGDYFSDVDDIQSDIGTLHTFTSVTDTALNALEKLLELPGKLEDQLRTPAQALNLPDPIVTALGLAPFGIGTAIKTIDNIAGEAADVIDAQADIMGALDDAWATPRAIVDAAQAANTVADTSLSTLESLNTVVLDEAEILVESLGGEEILESSELARRMNAYGDTADTWFATRDALLAPLNTAITGLQSLTDSLDSVIPDLSVVEDALGVVTDVFQPLKDAAQALKDALLAPVQPLFDALNAIAADAQSVLDAMADALTDVQDAFNDVLAQVADLVDAGSLFANTIIGDEAPGLIDFADDLTGTSGEDGIYGLMGDDKIVGGGGGDFLFGGADDDTLIGAAGNDEMYGGDGNDVVIGLMGNNLGSGGAGDDIVFGGSGLDTLQGGSGNDLMIGGGNADVFAFGAGDGADLIIGFEDDVDTIQLSADLLPGPMTAQQVVDTYGRGVGNIVVLNFGNGDKITITGLTDPNDLVDDLAFA